MDGQGWRAGEEEIEDQEPMLYRLLLRLLLLLPMLAWLALCVLGTVDVPETANLFDTAGSVLHHVIADL